MRDVTDITGYHAHVYFDAETRDVAERLRNGIAERFEVQLGRWFDTPIGPHTKGMYQVAFAIDVFASVVPFMMLNRGGLSILVHPMTGNAVADHDVNPLWLGERLPVDIEFLRTHSTSA
jgi:aromatic ring-cleaving dioxygenase